MLIRNLIRSLQDTYSACSSELVEIYGRPDFRRQQERYLSVFQAFSERYQESTSVVVARAPGRVTVAGQHSDYNHGQIVNFPIIQDTLIVAGLRVDSLVSMSNMDAGYSDATFDLRSLEVRLKKRADVSWIDYLKALFSQLHSVAQRKGSVLSGMNLLVDGRPQYGAVPIAAGLGSSAALLIGTGIVIAELAHPPLQLNSSLLATAVMRAENALGYPSGLQDPIGSLGGELAFPAQSRQAVLIDSTPRQDRGDPRVTIKTMPIPQGINVLLLNTGHLKGEDAWLEFNVRADEAKLGSFLLSTWLTSMFPQILDSPHLLQQAYPDIVHPDRPNYPPFYRPFYFSLSELYRVGVPISSKKLAQLVDRLPRAADRQEIEALGLPRHVFDELTAGSRQAGEDVGRRFFNLQGSVRHVITEQARVLQTIDALQTGNMVRLGLIQNRILNSLDINYRVVSAGARELSRIAQKVPGVLGARSLGGVWSSIVAVWTRDQIDIEQIMNIVRQKYYRPHRIQESREEMIRTFPGMGARHLFRDLDE
ncbi:MAG: galactokinase family protein [Rectinemataceae bacterium]